MQRQQLNEIKILIERKNCPKCGGLLYILRNRSKIFCKKCNFYVSPNRTPPTNREILNSKTLGNMSLDKLIKITSILKKAKNKKKTNLIAYSRHGPRKEVVNAIILDDYLKRIDFHSEKSIENAILFIRHLDRNCSIRPMADFLLSKDYEAWINYFRTMEDYNKAIEDHQIEFLHRFSEMMISEIEKVIRSHLQQYPVKIFKPHAETSEDNGYFEIVMEVPTVKKDDCLITINKTAQNLIFFGFGQNRLYKKAMNLPFKPVQKPYYFSINNGIAIIKLQK